MKKNEKKILIIRSVSFQQLDKNVMGIMEKFRAGDWAFYLLTHSHGMNRAGKYEMLAGTLDYRSRKNFSLFHLPGELKKNTFDAVIVPVTNKTGAGFLNVFLMTLRIKAEKIYCCNLVSEIWRVPRRKILFHGVKAVLFSAVSILFTAVSIILIPVLILPSLLLGKSKK
ncbi:MAG: hypothetical protein GY950_31715 [bacterium]|nr:hypothetical protein [bacterium]